MCYYIKDVTLWHKIAVTAWNMSLYDIKKVYCIKYVILWYKKGVTE